MLQVRVHRRAQRSVCRFVLALLLFHTHAWAARHEAAAAETIRPGQLLAGEVIPLDGTLDHPAWLRAAEHTAFVEALPVNGGKPAFETRLRVLVGTRALYIGIAAHDPHPEAIRAPLVRHDHVERIQDALTLYLDAVGKRRAAQFFRISASGSTADGIHMGDDDEEDRSPNFDFDAASARNPQGYTAVFRIPYASLRYTKEGQGPWRILVARTVPRDHVYLYVSQAVPAEALSFISSMSAVAGLASAGEEQFLQLRPNLTWRSSRETSASGAASGQVTRSAGIDFKWRPVPEWVLDATVNPDFSQVELDIPQLSRNTRFALYFPENRPFFLESVDLLRSPTDALYTRTVTSPRWGLRGSLRGDAVSGTAFAGKDAGGGLVLLPGPFATGTASQPASQLAAARMRMDAGGLTLGAVGAARHYEPGRGDNAVFGPDLTWQGSDSVRLRAQWLASYTTAQPDATGGLTAAPAIHGSRMYLNALMRSDQHELNLTATDTSAAFRNDSGFLAQSGVRFVGVDLRRFWRNLGPTNYLAATLTADASVDRASGKMESSQLTPGMRASWAQNSEASVEYHGASRLRVDAASPLLAERYWHWAYRTTPAAWASAVSVGYDRGRFADVTANALRDGERIEIGAKLRPLARLELEPSYTAAVLRNDRGRVYREYVARVLSVWHFAPRHSLRFIVQTTALERRAEPLAGVAAARDHTRAASLTYAWRRTAGTILYIGANREQAGLTPVQTRGSEIFVKLQFDLDEVRPR